VKLLGEAKRGGWMIVAADGSIDLTTPHGRAMAAMSATFAELERELIGNGEGAGHETRPAARGVASRRARAHPAGASRWLAPPVDRSRLKPRRRCVSHGRALARA
jgi:DNA invertase Pin-like site-specific DNA recombinase